MSGIIGDPNTEEKLPELDERYQSIEFIGRGGMGAVYKALDTQTNENVAIKVLRPELAADKGAVKRFEQEVTAAIELRHPNLVHVYSAGKTSDGIPYMVMNYIHGEGLDEVIRFERLIPTERAVNIFIQTAEAVAHAHSKGIVHRDLKPSNILITNAPGGEDKVFIVDFGIAKMLTTNIEQTQLTQSGELFGSPLYMSPEQCSGKPLDFRSDIYSLGCVMYEVLCGKPPFVEENPFQVMLHQVQSEPISIKNANPSLILHKDLDYLVMGCLQKDPKDRFQTIEQILKDLQTIKNKKRVKRTVQTNARQIKRFARFALILSVSFFLSWGLITLLSHFSGKL